ncbi:MAG: zinc ribbon domain-containing protein [Candidatus Omnitrophica bacterium]|nr:zinc ribbon domain-containing protein [Candidatus Omnitrophota bacterium]
MPTYAYECQACGHTFDAFQPITAQPLQKCPQCAKLKLRRLIGSGSGIIFKGSGFYQTDYRSEGYKQKAAADAPATGNTGGCATCKESKNCPASKD